MNKNIFFHPDPVSGEPELELEPLIEPKPGDPPPAPVPDISKQIQRSFAEGRGEGRKQTDAAHIEELKRLGIPLIKNDKGSVDFAKSLEQFRNQSYNAEEIVSQIKRESERREENLATEVATLKSTLKQRDLNHNLQILVTPYDPNDLDLAISALHRRFLIDEDDDGSLLIRNRDSSPILDTDSGKLASTERIIAMFFAGDNRWMLKPQRAGGGIGERDRKGTPKQISDEELQREFMSVTPGSDRERELRAIIMERNKGQLKG